jgi:predicted MFS family arabinose efflux permease
MNSRLFPWIVAVSGLLVLMVSNGMVISGITAFDESLIAEFGWARGDLKLRDLITLVGTGLCAPLIGVAIDRFGVRALLAAGSLMLAGGYLGYAHISALQHVYLIHLVFAVALVASGVNVTVIMVSAWFIRHRGTAVGLVLVGTSVGGVLFPPLITALIAEFGWRQTFQLVALAPTLVLLVAILLARSPHQRGVLPLGAGSIASDARAHGDAADTTLAQALRSLSFWALALVAGLSFYCMLGVISSLRLHLMDLGADPAAASRGFAWMMLMALVGKFLFGFLADRINQRMVLVINLAVMFIGASLLAGIDARLTFAATTLFGLGWGGLFTLVQLLAINSFGLTHAGKILGAITLIDASAGGLGAWLTNQLFAREHSYAPSYQLMVVLMGVALVAAFAVQRPRREPCR